MPPSRAASERVRRVVRKLDPDLLERERAALERYVDEAPDRKLQLMAFGAKVALAWAINPTDASPTRLLDWTEFALKLKRRGKPKTVPVLEKR